MALTELQPDAQLAALLAEFEASGGVIEYGLFSVDEHAAVGPELHKEAAIAALDIFGRDWGPQTIDLQKATGHPITLAEFLEPYYDLDTHSLIFAGTLLFTWAKSDHGEYATAGYADAFFDTPHGVALSQGHQRRTVWVNKNKAHLKRLFAAMSAALFCDFGCELSIYKWSTDCSSYFDPGREWWGAFFWTVYNPDKNMIVGVGASTTD